MNYPNDIIKNAIKSASKPSDFHTALSAYYSSCDSNTKGYIDNRQPKIECRPGCDYCCYLRVGVRAHEVYLIASYIDKHFKEAEKASLLDRLEAHWEKVSGLTRIEHITTNVACPLKSENQCSVYPVRPLSCRRYHSSDLQSCKYSYENPLDDSEARDKDPDLEMMWAGMTEMLNHVYEELGFDSHSYELGMALLEAFKNSKSEKRWRAKKKAFLEHPKIN